MASDDSPQPDSGDDSGQDRHQSTQAAREESAEEFMGPGFLEEVRKAGSKRRAFEFWYHPYVELAIFGLVILSVLLLIVEVSMPTGEPVGWLGGASAGQITGWFFWADIVITAILAAEYVSKLWITPAGRRWFFVRNTWIELLSLLPVLRVFRLFRIFRTVRIFRLMRVLRAVRLTRTGNLMARIFSGYGTDLQKNRAGNVIIATYFVSAMLFGTVGILIFEKGAGSDLDTMADALWWCVVTLSTVGYGDTVPVTGGGRVIAGIVMVLGLGFWSVMIGVFTTSLVRRARQKERIGLDILGIHDHVIVCGWNENGLRVIKDFHARQPFRHIVVVTEREQLGLSLDSRLHHLRADPTDDEAMQRAHLDNADTAVILAEPLPDADDTDVDARTLMTCLAARSSSPEIRIVVELLTEANLRHARSAGADDIVVTKNYAGSLMSQSVQSPGLNHTYQQLFEAGRGGRFRSIDIPEDCIAGGYSKLVARLYETRQLCLVAIRRHDRLFVAPDDDPQLREDDAAIVVEAPGDGLDSPPAAADRPLDGDLVADDTDDETSIVVCGWSHEARRMVDDLRAVQPDVSITVVCQHRSSEHLPSARSPNLEILEADPTDAEALEKAGVHRARSVVVVADRSHGGAAQTLDARTILTAMTVRQIDESVHLIAELRNENNLRLATDTGVDEWLFADQFSGVMLSQSLQSSGISQLFTALFETGAGSVLSEQTPSSSLIGTPFGDAIPRIIAANDGSPIGLRRNASIYLVPPPNLTIESGDRLLLIQSIDASPND